jgi:hypothetical protein
VSLIARGYDGSPSVVALFGLDFVTILAVLEINSQLGEIMEVAFGSDRSPD